VDLADAKTLMWLGLALLFALSGLGLGYALWRTGRALRRIEKDLHRTVDEVVPVITKAGVSMDTVNSQLVKLDTIMDSAVDMTDSLDKAVRAASYAVVEPVKKVSGAFAGVGEAVTSFRDRVADGPPDEPVAAGVGAHGPSDEDVAAAFGDEA
jgi:hypothetical protein